MLTEPDARAEVNRIATSGWSADGEGPEPWMERAPVHIFVCTREADYHERHAQADKQVDGREIEWPVPFWHVDAGAALMLILLAAIDEGSPPVSPVFLARPRARFGRHSASRTTLGSSPT